MAKKNDGLIECALEGCTNRFEPSGSGARVKRFCSRAHQQKHHITQGAKEYRAELDAKAEMLTCALPSCGRQFKARKALDGRDLKFYCSRACKDKHVDIKAKNARAEDRALPTAETDELISEMHRRGFYVMAADPSETDKHYKIDLAPFEGDTFKFAIAGDTHYCSRQQQHTHLTNFYHLCHEKEGITDFFNPGDVFNGSGKQHKGQEFENFLHGEDEQLAYVVDRFPKIPGCTTRIIGGSHDYSFFKLSGSDVTGRLAEKRDDIEYLGYAGAYIDISPHVRMYLYHPAGGTAYAVSYQPQKKVENFAPENKPNICIFGHYHRWLQMQHRNVEMVVAPCFQSQTPFLKAQGIFPIIGGVIVEVTVNENGIARFRAELIRYYVPIENDF